MEFAQLGSYEYDASGLVMDSLRDADGTVVLPPAEWGQIDPTHLDYLTSWLHAAWHGMRMRPSDLPWQWEMWRMPY